MRCLVLTSVAKLKMSNSDGKCKLEKKKRLVICYLFFCLHVNIFTDGQAVIETNCVPVVICIGLIKDDDLLNTQITILTQMSSV